MSHGYGEVSADSRNVEFPFNSWAAAATGLAQLATDTRARLAEVRGGLVDACADWAGPERTVFDQKVETLTTDANSIADALQQLADGIASAWAAARGNQDRINTARENKANAAEDGAWQNFKEFFTGEQIIPPPADPATPRGPKYKPTRQPKFPNRE